MKLIATKRYTSQAMKGFALFKKLFVASVVLGFAGSIAIGAFTFHAYQQLPPVHDLEDVHLQVPLKIFTSDGKLMAEFGEKRRKPINIEEVPKPFISAILATEDRRFYQHYGVDLKGLMRAAYVLVSRGEKKQGGSTITMQVARNFYLGRQKTFSRKFYEILLAIKIERELSKSQILELYLNKIYFGKRAYGIAAAAEVYYGKQIQDLSLAQMTMLAGLPQAPSAINPLNNPKAALKRRHHVLIRMHNYGFISKDILDAADQEPLSASYHGRTIEFKAPYVAEWVRKILVKHYGDEVYTSGFEVYTTLSSQLQSTGQKTVQQSLLAYDKRHGFRGPVGKLAIEQQLSNEHLSSLVDSLGEYDSFPRLTPSVILSISDSRNEIICLTQDAQIVTVPFSAMSWAKRQLSQQRLSLAPKKPSDVMMKGYIVYLEEVKKNQWGLSQLPEVSSALVSLEPYTGAVKALVGGYDFSQSKFNRATQALRQPGSNFKPIVYSAALENGFTPATIVNDAPIVFEDPTLEGLWRPQNHTKKFYGPTRMRTGLTRSRNLVSIRLLQALGLKPAIALAEKFGFDAETLPNGLSLALGTLVTTPLQVAASYATFGNGGFAVEPYVIHHIEDINSNILYSATPALACDDCQQILAELDVHPLVQLSNAPKPILSPETHYIMDSMLRDTIQTGTGQRAKKLRRRDIGGKTGTTNNQFDNWFSGYNQDLVTTTWFGFDDPKSLQEYAAQTALPLWIAFMDKALHNKSEKYFPQPANVVSVKIDPKTGQLAAPNQKSAIFEFFAAGSQPTATTKHTSQAVHKEDQSLLLDINALY